ncbi:hypothetical protein QCA50_007735 [Cerrena zonata]|uniref:Uncharacterized protein n=1 Tax=Cerrena zonata TaxID=2478898 RepID=A0AAW0GCH8_9APHY
MPRFCCPSFDRSFRTCCRWGSRNHTAFYHIFSTSFPTNTITQSSKWSAFRNIRRAHRFYWGSRIPYSCISVRGRRSDQGIHARRGDSVKKRQRDSFLEKKLPTESLISAKLVQLSIDYNQDDIDQTLCYSFYSQCLESRLQPVSLII